MVTFPHAVNVTRGVPFAPSAAAEQRRKEQEKADREREREAKRAEKRAYGRMLDEVEQCYKQRGRGRH